ncbi:MAG TPA: thiol:disulfide interchange protein DsbA/DsbL [Steroidobacteraceae bacterium]|nr:thiol:disulfide interchange protein DsbA/DsbL [Steroidobacteraceae bacterium]
MPSRYRRNLARLLCALTVLLISPVLRAQLQEGTNFRAVVPPQPTSQRSKIELVEFFSYGCPHCARFYPLLNAWVAKLPPDVVFRRVPVGFGRDAWVNLQRAFYSLESTGDLTRLDGPLFHAIHEERKPLFDESSIADWVGRNGGNADKFTAAYTSLGVNTQTFQADKMAEDFQIGGVPALGVDGRYVALVPASKDEVQGLSDLLANTDQLIARVRSERTAAKPAPAPKAR